MNFQTFNNYIPEEYKLLYFACIFILVGFSFILGYLIARKKFAKNTKEVKK
jgi:hypothetical protein